MKDYSVDIAELDVVILCGGLGRRLRKISGGKPKCLMKMGRRVFLDILLDYMRGLGFKHFILGVGYKADAIKNYYTRHQGRDRKITFSREKTPLGTGGAVKHLRHKIKSRQFFVLNGDSFCEFNARDFLAFHRKNRALVSILLSEVKDGSGYGQVKLVGSNRISGFSEKKKSTGRCLANAGVYIFEKRIFDLMPPWDTFSLERDFFPVLVGKKLLGYKNPGYFIDIGTPRRYRSANSDFIKHNRDG